MSIFSKSFFGNKYVNQIMHRIEENGWSMYKIFDKTFKIYFTVHENHNMLINM